MKIAILNNLYEPYHRGGAEQVVKLLINQKISEGHEVFLISTKPRHFPTKKTSSATKNPEEQKPESEQTLNSPNKLKIYYLKSFFYQLPTWPLWLRSLWHLTNIFSWPKYLQVKKILKIERPDLLISHNLMGLGFMTPLAVRHLNIPHEHWLHDIQLIHPSGLIMLGQEQKTQTWSAKTYQLLTRALFASPHKIISPSTWLLTEHKTRGFFKNSNQEISITKPGFSRGGAAPQESPIKTPGANDGKVIKKLLFVGQIEAHKGVVFLLQAFKKLTAQNINLILIGDGGVLPTARALADNNQHIQFKGRLKSPEIAQMMLESDYLIVPSLCYENSPTVIHEAQALGLSVIAANLGGIPEIIGPKDKLFKAGDENDLLEILKNI